MHVCVCVCVRTVSAHMSQVIAAQNWTCYMCKDLPRVGMLTKRSDWDVKLRQLFENDHEMEYVSRVRSEEGGLHNSSPNPLKRV